MRSNLSKILETIPAPSQVQGPQAVRYYVRPIPEAIDHYFGRTREGFLCLLLASHDSAPRAPLRLAAIEVSFAVPCQITIPGEPERTETLTAVSCTSADAEIQRYFSHVCETILRIVGMHPSLREIIDAVRRLVDLFQKLSRPSKRSVTGLFGELFVISSSSSPAAAVQAWRSTLDDRFDFSTGDLRLEVKASSTRQRSHNFSLEQCVPPAGATGILISLFVESSGGGLSLLELVRRIERQLDADPDLMMKLQETVAEALGATAAAALPMRFDERLARTSLQIYELLSIPAIRTGVPAELSQVRFRSDISRTPPASAAALITRCASACSVLPARP
jgi:Putative  PD-(D/E)XK family member, (DUF4420)